jgi:SSS family solute:Na+ symporter
MSMFGAKSEAGARWSMFVAGVVVMIFSVVIGIAGMYAYSQNPNLQGVEADRALLWLVTHVLPGWLAAFVVVSVTSGIFSCANGNAMAISTFFVRHVYPLATGGRYPRNPLLAARMILVVAFILCITVAIHSGTIVSFVLKFLPVTMSGLAIIVLLGRFWPRATWQGALAAQIITPAISLIAIFWGKNIITAWPQAAAYNNAVFLAVPGVIAHVVVSLLSPKPKRSFAEVAASLKHEREKIGDQSLDSALETNQ